MKSSKNLPKMWKLICDGLKNETSLMSLKKTSKAGLQTNDLVEFLKDIYRMVGIHLQMFHENKKKLLSFLVF